ncbi:MAG TPA: NB-ARC domain-containing protein [Planosporangium sp.]|jgi:DNA-binding XRE family transcriptional regulator|nr:NB-ARC domain-containing protein [Planosporangium sp.]
MRLGVLVRGHRRRLGLTQEELAHKAAVSVRTIRDIESGRTCASRSQTIRLIADALSLHGTARTEFQAEAVDPSAETADAAPARVTLTGSPPAIASSHNRRSTTRPAQLPSTIPDFVGRDDALAAVDAVFAQHTLHSPASMICAVSGIPGVGKTALVVHWAHRVRHRFPDGQLYVNLRGHAPGQPLRPIEVLARFLHALSVPADEMPLEADEAASMYRTLLAGKRILVVLDNARDADQVRPLIPGSTGCAALVTSRDRLTGLVAKEGAHLITLEVLDEGNARVLLEWILGVDRVRAESEAADELVQLCGALPLALRGAAANLTGNPHRAMASYAAELRAGDRLTALEVHGDRQTAVRAAFELSYANLSADTQRLFRRLALGPGAYISVDEAGALAGIGIQEAHALLLQLLGKHLVTEIRPGQYVLHDLFRLYAHERCVAEDTAPDRRAAIGRLCDYYLCIVDPATRLLYSKRLVSWQNSTRAL